MSLPEVVSRDEWLAARKKILVREKELTRQRDQLNADRRRMPMVKIEKEYLFQSPEGRVRLLDLFEGRRQLIVFHFMWAPDWDEGCPSCTATADEISEGLLDHLNVRGTSLAFVSRAPLAKLERLRNRKGWAIPWYSSFGTDFNYDFEVSTENGESPGVSTFYRAGDEVFFTYSIFDRGGDIFKNFYNYLDITHLGRREDELEHPWDWWRHKDRYDDQAATGPGDNWWNGTRYVA